MYYSLRNSPSVGYQYAFRTKVAALPTGSAAACTSKSENRPCVLTHTCVYVCMAC